MTVPKFSSTPTPTERDLTLYLAARFSSVLATQIQILAVGWQVYDLTHDPFPLGFVGFAQFLPMALTVLPAGDLADRADRRKMLLCAYGLAAAAVTVLLSLSLSAASATWPFYVAAAMFGFATGLQAPAQQSFVPFLVPEERLLSAIAASSTANQLGVILGPLMAGVLLYFGIVVTYAAALCLIGIAMIAMASIRMRRAPFDPAKAVSAFRRMTEGLRYVARQPILAGAITLDLFAVLFGGVTALLPIYASDILDVGRVGLGVLRASPAVGAAAFALIVAMRPMERHLGIRMFGVVALFGVATIVFGLSRNIYLSVAALVVLGASDQVSVVIRNTLVQMRTPDSMRGRVSAVHMLFVGTSNLLGEFRAGTAAGFIGTVGAVVIGGVGTLVVTGLWMAIFPPLRRVDRFTDVKPAAAG